MKKLVILFIVLVFSLPLLAQFEEYKKSVFVNGEHSLPYRFLEPENFSKSKKYPVVIFLHGSGERGVDNEKQLIHGAQQFLNPVFIHRRQISYRVDKGSESIYLPCRSCRITKHTLTDRIHFG